MSILVDACAVNYIAARLTTCYLAVRKMLTADLYKTFRSSACTIVLEAKFAASRYVYQLFIMYLILG